MSDGRLYDGFVPGRHPIDAYGNGGFRFADMSHRGSILACRRASGPGPVDAVAELTPTSSRAGLRRGRRDRASAGRHRAPTSRPLPAALRARFREARDRPRRDADRRGRAHLQHPARREPQGRRGPDRRSPEHGDRRPIVRSLRPLRSPRARGRSGPLLRRASSRRPTSGRISSRSMPSTSRSPACATRSARRWPARSACNGGATPCRARRGATCGPTRSRRRSTTPSCSSGCRGRRFVDLIDARIFDLYDDPMPSLNDLEGYCGETSSA